MGYGLLARCESFIEANEARAGRARCPRCSVVVAHSCGKEEILRCDCGWELAWGEYFKTIQHVQLSGAEPVLELFRTFAREFPSARTPQERTLAIDRLIHGFHGHYKKTSYDEDPEGKPTRPVAVNLIEGRLNEVVAFLEQLTYGDKSTPGTMENYSQWDDKIGVNRDWYSSLRKGKAQPADSRDG